MGGENFGSNVDAGPRRRKAVAWSLLAAVWALVGIGVLWAAPPAASLSAPGSSSPQPSFPGTAALGSTLEMDVEDASGQLRREGTQLRDERGHFELNGTRVIFVSAEEKTRFIGLENLNLQRISQILDGEFAKVEWIVSGLVTEYQGANYLLLLRVSKATSGSGRRRSF